ncbi:SET domain-containing protein [Heliocybe sulcata]|uniref:SET domain-containing protein n=1 Tax=Heliocybe sulcata TaxID=5364 RepID=A0A5C3N687_9AGAM|nr:SET domain-containing protein [Heliocybe sulcata]
MDAATLVFSGHENQDCYFDVSDYNGTNADLLRAEVLTIPEEFNPFVHSYESNTPASHNIFHGDDPDDMPFVPFADDPFFNAIEHQRHYKNLTWQEGLLDPDLNIIVVECARRLLHDSGISAEDVDKTNILPDLLISKPGKRGALEKASLRDYPVWPSDKATPQLLVHSTVPHFGDLSARVSSSVQHFCPNLNCIDPYCPTHIELYAMPPPQVPLLLNDEMATRASGACGKDCFLSQHEESSMGSAWSQEDLTDFASLLELMPDTSPCDLAVICRKPCCEERPPFFAAQTTADIRFFRFSDSVASQFISNVSCRRCGPCQHVGSCTEYIRSRDGSIRQHCVCALNKTYCERNCRCYAQCCELRWPGCTCARRAGACTSKHCPCIKEGRECDPELCIRSVCSPPPLNTDVDRNICQNAQLQQGRRKRISVKGSRSGFGLGAFIDEPAKYGDLIGEYVGEIIYEPTVESREDVAHHRRRNYVFELNDTFSVDSSNVGNETRFINHSRRSVNCRAEVRLVNGEHKIGIYAGELRHCSISCHELT